MVRQNSQPAESSEAVGLRVLSGLQNMLVIPLQEREWRMLCGSAYFQYAIVGSDNSTVKMFFRKQIGSQLTNLYQFPSKNGKILMMRSTQHQDTNYLIMSRENQVIDIINLGKKKMFASQSFPHAVSQFVVFRQQEVQYLVLPSAGRELALYTILFDEGQHQKFQLQRKLSLGGDHACEVRTLDVFTTGAPDKPEQYIVVGSGAQVQVLDLAGTLFHTFALSNAGDCSRYLTQVDGQHIACATQCGQLYLFHVPEKRLVASVQISFSENSKDAATDKSQLGQRLSGLRAHITPKGDRLVIVGTTSTLLIYKGDKLDLVHNFPIAPEVGQNYLDNIISSNGLTTIEEDNIKLSVLYSVVPQQVIIHLVVYSKLKKVN